jgi:hemerythrin
MEDFFKWRDDWVLHVDAIDNQHKVIAECLNEIAHLCLAGNNRTAPEDERLAGLLDRLYADTRQHFSDEERLMLESRYPGYTLHEHEHIMLLAELKNYNDGIKNGSEQLDIDILSSLKAWFITHITHSDKEFASYLLDNPAGRDSRFQG